MKKRARFLPNAYLILVLTFLYLPTLVVVLFSFNKSNNGVLWTGFTTQWYAQLFKTRAIMESFGNSLIVALISCAAAAVLGTLGALALARSKFRGKGLLVNVASLPIMLPEIVIGLAFMTFFSALGISLGITTLVLAHTAFCVPYVLIIVQSRLVGLDPALEEAARDLGASPAQAFFSVTLPLILPAVLSGVLLAFAMSLDDMVISFFVTGPTTTTFPVYVFGKLKTDVPPSINAMCTLTLGLTLIVVALSQYVRARNERKQHIPD